MSHEVCTEIELDAPIEKVWALLEDVDGYRNWSRIFRFTQANARPGGRALLWARVGGPVSVPLPVKFDVFDEKSEIRWHGGARPIGYGSHYLRLEPLEGGGTRLIHGEAFDGLAVRAGWPLIGERLPGAYRAFNREVARQLS